MSLHVLVAKLLGREEVVAPATPRFTSYDLEGDLWDELRRLLSGREVWSGAFDPGDRGQAHSDRVYQVFAIYVDGKRYAVGVDSLGAICAGINRAAIERARKEQP